jgi:GrpB-like predicted nucleotidyltransferase (UPF0157 family)
VPTSSRHPSLDDRFDPAVRIVEHDPAWAALAQEETARIAAAVGRLAVRVEHVGSTSVPGLAAKPILDLQLSVTALEPLAAITGPLEGIGYLFVPDPESADHLLFARPPERPRSHHLHVCEAGGEQELRHLAVRDYLRTHPEEAAAYAALKREIVARHPQDRLAYMAGKDAFVVALEARALRWIQAQAPPGGSQPVSPIGLDSTGSPRRT